MPRKKSSPPATKPPYEPTAEDRRLVEAHRERRKRRRKAARVKIEKRGAGPFEVGPDHPDSVVGQVSLLEGFGTTERDFANQQVIALIHAVQGPGEGPIKELAVNAALAAVNAIEPKDEVEGMLAAQMAATHHLALDMMQRAGRADYLHKVGVYGNLGAKFLRAFTAQLDALQRYRGKGQQKIVVERVNVGDGGQAIVGNVGGPPGRDDETPRPVPKD
jgi:hypothetical protein